MSSNLCSCVLGLGLILTGAGRVRAQTPMPDSVVRVAPDDSAMNVAITKAQATIGEFIQRLDHPPASQTDIGLKVRLTDGHQVEHVWLANVRHAGNRFSGIINNTVEKLADRQIGDSVTVGLHQVSDWLAIDAGRLIGGYSIRLLRDRMSPAERAKFDQQVPFRVE